jgi:excisionase family DNA binding protein
MTNPFETLDKRQSNIESILLDLSQTIHNLKNNFEPKQPTEYLSRNEVAELLKCTLPTIHNWAKTGVITSYGINGRVYFKRSEIESALVCLNKKKGANND